MNSVNVEDIRRCMTQNNPLQPGDVVAGLEPNEHVEIQKVTPFGGQPPLVDPVFKW